MMTKPALRVIRWMTPALLIVISGCFKLSRESPRLQQYVLSGASQLTGDNTVASAQGFARSTETGITVGLRRIDLASYLSVPSIVIRRGENELLVSEFHRWGEDPGEGINRVVAGNMSVMPPIQAVDVAPWAARARHDFLVQLRVSRFEGVVDSAATVGSTHLRAGWDIIRPLDGRVLFRGTTDDRGGSWRVGDYSALVTELDAALVRLARDISSCLSRFPNDSTPPTSCGSATTGVGDNR